MKTIADFRKNAPQFKGVTIQKIDNLLFMSKSVNISNGMCIAFNKNTGNAKEVTWESYKSNFQNDGEHILLPTLVSRYDVYSFLSSVK